MQVPKRKPDLLSSGISKSAAKDSNKPPPPPKKFAAFQASDSRAIEAAYQRLLEGQEERYANPSSKTRPTGSTSGNGDTDKSRGAVGREEEGTTIPTRVAVNEDFLFDVDIFERELAPVYWHGPVYEVRRGTWFYQEGSSLRPCEENLAAQLEEGYLKTKPWLQPTTPTTSDSEDVNAKADPGSVAKPAKEAAKQEPLGSSTLERPAEKAVEKSTGTATPPPPPPSYRLFGTYMNSVATYQDASTAWVSADGIISWVTSSVYQRFAGGGYMSGVKLIRGYSEPKKTKDSKRPKTPTESSEAAKLDDKEQKALKRKSAPPTTKAGPGSALEGNAATTAFGNNSRMLEEQIRQRQENEISDDYNVGSDESQGRDIEHLVLVTHGIGQLLSLR